MNSFSLNLPNNLKEQAEKFAANQEITLQMFILLALAEKVGVLNQPKVSKDFPNITYVTGASGVTQACNNRDKVTSTDISNCSPKLGFICCRNSR